MVIENRTDNNGDCDLRKICQIGQTQLDVEWSYAWVSKTSTQTSYTLEGRVKLFLKRTRTFSMWGPPVEPLEAATVTCSGTNHEHVEWRKRCRSFARFQLSSSTCSRWQFVVGMFHSGRCKFRGLGVPQQCQWDTKIAESKSLGASGTTTSNDQCAPRATTPSPKKLNMLCGDGRQLPASKHP